MAEFIWIIEKTAWIPSAELGLPANLVVPGVALDGSSRPKRRDRIWIVMRGEDDRLSAVVVVKATRLLTDELSDGDLFIVPDVLRSFQISQKYEELERFAVSWNGAVPPGLHVLEPARVRNWIDSLT